jgi:hypothetical protein
MQKQRGYSVRCSMLALLGIFLMAVTTLSFGQDINASLSGTVLDPGGAVIPGAKLTLTNEASGFQSNFISDGTGQYSFRNLTPGKYDLTVSATGFKSADQKGIELAVNQVARVEIHLQIGKADETVTVTADTSLINFENQTLEGGVSPEALQDFPLVVSGAPRSSVAVATMMPGVTSAGGNNAFQRAHQRRHHHRRRSDRRRCDHLGRVHEPERHGRSADRLRYVARHHQRSHMCSPPTTTRNTETPLRASSSSKPRAVVRSSMAADTSTSATTSSTPANTAVTQRPVTARVPTRKTTTAPTSAALGMSPASMATSRSSRATSTSTGRVSRITAARSAQPTTIASLNARAGNFSGWGNQLYYPNDPAKYGALAGTAIPGQSD